MTEQKSRAPLGQRALTIMELADRPEGVTMREAVSATGVDALEQVSGRFGKLVKSGFLWRVKRTRATRFFSSPEAASAWNKANPPKVAAPSHVERGYPIHIARPKAGKAKQRPAAHLEAVAPAGVKHTIRLAPKFDARYQIDPDAHHFGAGFAHVGIGRDVNTGRAWGA